MFKKCFGKILLCFILAVVFYFSAKGLGFVGGALAGAGHGTPVLAFLFDSPIYDSTADDSYVLFGPYIWGTVGFLLPLVGQWYFALMVVVLVAINYVGASRDICNLLKEEGTDYVHRIFSELPIVSYPLVVIYVAVQLVILWRLISAKPWRRKASKSAAELTTG